MTRAGKIALLAGCLSLCLAAVLVSGALDRMRHDPAREIYEVVNNQLTALKRSNFEAAYTQTSEAIRVRFDVDQFRGMLMSHYHPLLMAERIELGAVSHADGFARMQAYLIDTEETVTPCVYHFVMESGGWRVSGVYIQPSWPGDYRLGGIRS